MCTSGIEQVQIRGAAKGASGWIPVQSVAVYYDHPFFASGQHTLNLDFRDNSEPADPAKRLAVELSYASALQLVEGITKILTSAEVQSVLSDEELDEHGLERA